MIDTIDSLLLRIQHRIRIEPLLYRFTLGTRILLAVGFIPTGMVKVLGLRFAMLNPETGVGAFFEVLYQSGPYWQFLGLTQVLAGLLVLIPAAATAGAILFSGIMLNIFVITISYDFNYTPVVTGPMLLATLWLLLWDYDRLRGLFSGTAASLQWQAGPEGQENRVLSMPQLTLSGTPERVVYTTGLAAGFVFFSVLRGLSLPEGFVYILLLLCLASFFTAVVFGIIHRKRIG